MPQYGFIAWRRKKTSLTEDKRKDKVQRAHTCRNPKGHIPLVSLLLWRKMVAVHCFVLFALQPCNCGRSVGQAGRQAGRQTKMPSFSDYIFEILYLATY